MEIMNEINHKLDELQKQINNTTNRITKSHLLLQRIDLLKIQKAQKPIQATIKEILEQLEKDLKK